MLQTTWKISPYILVFYFTFTESTWLITHMLSHFLGKTAYKADVCNFLLLSQAMHTLCKNAFMVNRAKYQWTLVGGKIFNFPLEKMRQRGKTTGKISIIESILLCSISFPLIYSPAHRITISFPTESTIFFIRFN